MMLLIAIPDVVTGALNGVYLSVISIGIMAAFESVAQIPQAFQYLSKSTEAGKRLFDIVDTHKNEDEINLTESAITDYNLRLENISFSYDTDNNALSNISFRINEGERVAIVGASGAGKSTLVNLLTKLWDYNTGNIFIGNENYKVLSSTNIRNIISVVPQKVQLFTGTVKENLLIAKDGVTDSELMRVLSEVGLDSLINSLPDKLNTNIGELGQKLSGGESKRLTIARALLRNSPIIIFDEATSHVDNLTEKKILETIKELPATKSVIFITHRLNQMDLFDNIIVLSNGRVVESGTHTELLAKGNFYKKLIDSQNQNITLLS
jgi:ATP-binding cassette subfamily C protein CydC